MSRLGTCRHTHKVQAVYRGPHTGRLADLPPHINPESDEAMAYIGLPRSDDVPDDPSYYLCGWVINQHGLDNLPPPLRRTAGALSHRDGDCDACPMYAAHAIKIPGVKE